MIAEANAGQQLGDAGIDLRARTHAGQFQRQRDVVGDGFRGEQVEVLEDHSDALAELPQAVGIQRGDVFAVDQDASAAGFFEAVDQAQQGALAGAGVADQTEDLAALDAQVGGLQGRDFAACALAGDAVCLVDLVKLDHGKRTFWAWA